MRRSYASMGVVGHSMVGAGHSAASMARTDHPPLPPTMAGGCAMQRQPSSYGVDGNPFAARLPPPPPRTPLEPITNKLSPLQERRRVSRIVDRVPAGPNPGSTVPCVYPG
jgi:hypothetical protein